MAIHAYVGKPGHGKSYSVVERVVIPSLKQGRLVVTNIPLHSEELLADFGGSIIQLPEDWDTLHDLDALAPPGCVLILDEIWKRWPNGQKANQANALDKALLAEHRHRVDDKNNSMRIVMVTQDLSQIASWARTLIEQTHRSFKFNQKAFRVDIYTGPVTGDSPPKSKLVRQVPCKFKSSIQAYYKSATFSETGEVGDESVADKSGSILRSYGLWALIIIIVIGLVFGTRGVSKFFDSPPSKVLEHKSVTSVSSSPPESKPAVAIQPRPIVIYSKTWRLAGFVHVANPSAQDQTDNSVAVLVDGDKRTRYLSFLSCRYNSDFKEAYCDVDGERVTPWTSQNSSFQMPPVIGGFSGGTAQRSASSPSG